MAAKLALDILNSGAARMFGGALCGGLVVILIMRLFRSYGTEVAVICLIGILIAVLFIILIYYLYKNVEAQRQQKLDAELEKKAIEKQRKDRLQKNVKSLKSNWQQAMEDLKHASINMYDLPWFMVIGEPQSGKTTLLRESNLKRSTGNCKVEGAGGTENCNWWFFDDAVLLDTAGRFSMPVTNLPDQDEWIKFLDILVKSRPRCPVNGVIVAIPLTSLLSDSNVEIKRKAENIQNKLLELTNRLGVEFPVYIMITKMDLLHGFFDFCFTLKGQEDTQIFGWNREESFTKPYDFNELESQFYIQTQRLYMWSMRILRDMPPEGKIEAIYSFSHKFSQIRKPLHQYCEIIFENHKMKTPLSWRGTFFSSGVQKGKEFIDSLGKIVDEGFQDQIKKDMKTRPYFIYNFCKKLFIEKGLVKPTKKRHIKQRNIRLIVVALTVFFLFISILMLIPGYQKLKNQVFAIHQPLQYSKTFITKQNQDIHTEKELPKIIHYSEKLQNTISAISQKGATKRFLHGSENELYEGLKTIETALILKGIYRPFFQDAAGRLSKIAHNSTVYRETIRKALRQLLMVYYRRPITGDDCYVLFELFPNTHYWKQHRKFFYDSLKTYNENLSSAVIITDIPLFKSYLKDGFDGLYHYWQQYPDVQWKNIHDRVESIAKSYLKIIELNPQTISTNSINEGLNDFYEKGLMLTGQANIQPLMTAQDIEVACISDFDYLIKDIKDELDQMLRDQYQKGISQCSKTRQQIEKVKDTSLSVYGHLIESDGRINPELNHMINLVKALNDVTSLFTEKNRQEIGIQEADYVKVLDKQYSQWIEKQTKVNETVLRELGAIKSEGWDEERLKLIIKSIMDIQIQNASKEAAYHSISFVLQETMEIDKLSSSDRAPSLARSKYLIEQFKELKKIENWAYSKNIPLSEAQKLSEIIRNKMLKSYNSFIQLWSNTIKYDPASAYRRISTWEKFRNKLSQEQGVIIDAASYPLRIFLENVSETDLNELQDKIVSESRSVTIQERNVLKCARVYGGPLRSELEKVQEKFFERVETISMELDSLDTENLSDVKKQLKSSMMSLSVFNSFIRESGKECLAISLRTVQKKAISLLNKKIKKIDSQIQQMKDIEKKQLENKWQSVQNKWKEGLNKWRVRIGHLYPFDGVIPKINQALPMKKIITIPTASYKDIQTVFFDPDTGIRFLLSEIEQERANNPMASEPDREDEIFIEKSSAWQSFLFDQDSKPKKHKLEITLLDCPIAARKFTRLDIEGFETMKGRSKAQFRFSGTRYTKNEVYWSIDSKPIYTIKATNEETNKFSQCVLNGENLNILGLLTTSGREGNTLFSTDEWILQIDLPYQSEFGKNSNIPVLLKFKWDEPIPDMVHFP